MTDKFTWRVHATASGGGEFVTEKAQFGEGYGQEAPIALNPEVQKWSVTVSGLEDEMRAVVDFVRARAGIAFLWTPPLSDEGYYKCTNYKPSDQGGGYWSVTLDFEQGYMP